MMREEKPVFVVTGVSGLIGSALVEELSRGYRVVGMDINEPSKEEMPRLLDRV